MQWEFNTPKKGDIIRVKVSFYYHYGIFVDEKNVIQFGLPDEPIRSKETITVLKSDIYTFLSGGVLEVGIPDKDERKKMYSPDKIVENAYLALGEGGYDILHNNCEHFVNKCAFGDAQSAFLDGVRKKLREKLGKK